MIRSQEPDGPDGPLLHLLRYDGWSQPLWHDLASFAHAWTTLDDCPRDDSPLRPADAPWAKATLRTTLVTPPPADSEKPTAQAPRRMEGGRETRALVLSGVVFSSIKSERFLV